MGPNHGTPMSRLVRVFHHEAEGVAPEATSQWDLFVRRLLHHRLAVVSSGFLVIVIAIAVAAPLLTCPPGDANQFCGKPLEHYAEQLVDDHGRLLVSVPPRADFPFGTDSLGRDVMSRVIHGARASLLLGVVVGVFVVVLGTAVGAIAGYYPGAVDQTLMRFTDLVMGLPVFPVVIVAARLLPDLSVVPGWMRDGVFGIAAILAFLAWGALARIVRAEFLSLREREYVEAARAAGAKDRRIIVRHILPNALGPIIVTVTLVVSTAILAEATLSFLGFGIRPPTPTWGGMVDEGAALAVRGDWWLLVFSGVAITSVVLAVNFIGDGLRDALDPAQTIERT